MNNITANAKSVRELLAQKYAVDSYQREYKWGKKQIEDLVNDLTLSFDSNYKETHEQADVKNYGQYFLGPIIISEGSDKQYIVDGQQRLTSVTLMLISLLHSVESEEQKTILRHLIYSEKFGKKSFNLDVPERTKCLEKLYEQGEVLAGSASQSVRNLVDCYEQITDTLDEWLTENEKQLPLFIDYLIEKVYLVEIRASSTNDAYVMFETMNDRGLSLSPVEMLKSYLLSMITDNDQRESANRNWKKRIDELVMLGKAEDASAIKAWLRGRQASDSRDFDMIGGQFHRWVRDNERPLELEKTNEFLSFIQRDFQFYMKWFLRLRKAAKVFDAECTYRSCIYYLAQHSFTLQYPALLSVLSPDDSEPEIEQKLRVTATYLDILIHYRLGNRKKIAESSMRDIIFGVIKKIRDLSTSEIAQLLHQDIRKQINDSGWNSTLAQNFALHGTNRPRVHRILARITDYVATQSGKTSHYTAYFATGKNDRFEIEHIWRNQFDDARNEEFAHEHDFQGARNKIGGLLLLPKNDNASYKDKSYPEKYPHYIKQNLLAQSLHEICYKNNPGFLKFVENSKLPFKHYTEFTKDALEARQQLYLQIADKIWNPERLLDAASQ